MSFNLFDSITPLEKRILDHLELEKPGKDRKIRKIADILIENKMISSEITRMHINHLRKIKSREPFETLLLALLLADDEEFGQSTAILNEFIGTSGSHPIIADIQQYLILIRVSELNDFSNIEKDALSLIENCGTEDNIIQLLWKLSGIIKAAENPELFMKLVDFAINKFPFQFRLHSYKGWLYKEQKSIIPAIDEYLKTLDGLSQETDNEYFNFEMASTLHNLAECCLLLPDQDAGKAIEYCNQAQKHDELSEEFVIGSPILLTRAKAYLLLNYMGEEIRNNIMADINKVLEHDPDHEEARSILQKINTEQS